MEDFQKILENFSLIFVDKQDKEKIILKLDSKSEHYTVHFGTKSKVLDIHKTIELPDNQKNYETLIKINHFTIGRVLVQLKSVIDTIELFFFSNRVNPGFLRKNKCYVQSLDEKDITDLQILNYNERKGKIKLKDSIANPEVISQLFNNKIDKDLKAAPYLLWKLKKGSLIQAGLLFVVYSETGEKLFFFISKKAYNAFLKIVFTKILIAFEKSSVQSENSLLPEIRKLYDEKYNRGFKRVD